METEQPLSWYKALLADDRAFGFHRKNPLWIILHMISEAGLSAVFLHRLAHLCYDKGQLGKQVAKVLVRLNIFLNGCQLGAPSQIGPGFYLPHPVGIVIGEATIGRNVTIYQNVTLGLRHPWTGIPEISVWPRIADNATILAGAVVLGGVKIGKRSIVGANAVVLQDVPDDCIAVGIPARILPKKEGYPSSRTSTEDKTTAPT